MRQLVLIACTALLSIATHPGPAVLLSEPEQNCFIVEGMHVEWSYEGDFLTFQLHSPYPGWLALGFNTINALPGSHRINGQVVGKGPDLAEQFVLGFGDARSFSALGARSTVLSYEGHEDGNGTTFTFTLDTRIQDEFHHDLREGQRIWLICSYSLSDDFNTPSVMQRHVEVQL
jgi:hypothetical protein